MSFQLNVSDGNKVGIIKEIQDSLVIAQEKREETDFFDNGHGIRKWGYIYKNLSEAEMEELLPFNTRRQGWKLSFRFDPLNKTLFCLLSKNNLETKQKQKSDVMHYVSAISEVVNVNFEDKLSDEQKQEIQLALALELDNEQAKKIYQEMLGDINFEIEQFCVLSLDIVNYELTGVTANILNGNFEILYNEDWSAHIKVSSMDDNDSEKRAQESQQHDMNVKVKVKSKKEKG